MPEVVVTKHAIRRFRDWRRTAARDLAWEQAEKILARAAREGEFVQRLPGGAFELAWQDVYLVVKRQDGALVVLTVNGDNTWRAWFRKEHARNRRRLKVRAAL